MLKKSTGKQGNQTATSLLSERGIKRSAIRKKPVQHEYIEQCGVVAWARASQNKYPGLELLHCSLNGVKLTLMQSVRAKKQGMLAGVADLFLPIPRNGFNGLYIEMKAKKVKANEGQLSFIDAVMQHGYLAVVCVGAEAAIQTIKDYYAVIND